MCDLCCQWGLALPLNPALWLAAGGPWLYSVECSADLRHYPRRTLRCPSLQLSLCFHSSHELKLNTTDWYCLLQIVNLMLSKVTHSPLRTYFPSEVFTTLNNSLVVTYIYFRYKSKVHYIAGATIQSDIILLSDLNNSKNKWKEREMEGTFIKNGWNPHS